MQPRPISETFSLVPRVRWFMGICPFLGSVVGSGGVRSSPLLVAKFGTITKSACIASGSLFGVMFAMPSLLVRALRKCAPISGRAPYGVMRIDGKLVCLGQEIRVTGYTCSAA